MRQGIDHLVLPVRDLEAARDRYRAMGFTLTPRASHDWGTDNSLVQLDGSFLEILTVAYPEKLFPEVGRTFSFGEFNRDFLERREGFSMLVFEGLDTASEQRRYNDLGFGPWDPFHFERTTTLPSGETATVAFDLAFATDPALPDARFFTCKQTAPHLFWKREYQRHANGAQRLVDVVMIAEDPPALADIYRRLCGERAVAVTHDTLSVVTLLGRILVLTPMGMVDRFGVNPAEDCPETPHFAAYTVQVADLDAVGFILANAGIAHIRAGDRVTVPPATGFGTAISFVGG
ncbi:MAG: VOC family protein [Alphaproteobacteria bacterium]|nr:VOC family protein [Alphaproteobacteria bacterium]